MRNTPRPKDLQNRRVTVNTNQPARPDIRKSVKSPEVLCIYNPGYRSETLDFFNTISKGVFGENKYILLDFSKLTNITAAAAVILFAHVTRAQNVCSSEIFRFRDQVIKITFGKNRKALDIFRQTHLFEAIKPGGEKKLKQLWNSPRIPFKTHNQPSEKHVEIVAWLKKNCGTLPPRMSTAIQEALLNITHHSYQLHKGLDWNLQPFMVNRWWHYSKVEVTETGQYFTFIIYDMGSGIPMVAKNRATSKLDAEIIKEAMTRGFSSTGMPGRGNGSYDILKPIAQLDNLDTLYVYSNRGEVQYRYNKVEGARTNLDTISGTLLEWSFSN